MRTAAIILLAVAVAAPLAAQEQPTSENPLMVLKADLTRVLVSANLPFTPDQERAIALMMEDRRQASEVLFGGLMDFRSGPTSGQDAERLQSAIGWLRNEFVTKVKDYLTPEQLPVWNGSLSTAAAAATRAVAGEREPRPAQQQQTQYVRINNNRFTAEDGFYQGGGGQGGTEVIQRGGAGAWHGNFQTLFKDDALNARNAFADNKPPYQERQINFDVGGPVIPGRLTSNAAVFYSLAQNVDTINAILPTGPFALGITRPTVNWSFSDRTTLQLTSAHSLAVNVRYATDTNRDEGIGGFTLQERASDRFGRDWNVELRQFSSLASGSIYETRFNISGFRSRIVPFSDAVKINVSDTFNSGGAQNRTDDSSRNYDFGNLYTRPGRKVTIKAGMEGAYRTSRSLSLNNFGGTYTFSNLDDYLAGAATTYRVAQGEPLQKTTQLEWSAFVQNDLQLTPQLTLMFGVRYDAQTNLRDYNNVAPRVGFAYGIGRGSIIRGGGGVFFDRLQMDRVATQQRFDGIKQFEIVIDAPLYPDPFSGTVRQTFPSIRVTDPNLPASYSYVGMISLEKTLWTNLLVTATYDYTDKKNRYAIKDLNQPRDITAPVPTACTLATSVDNCVRPDPTLGSVLNLQATSFQATHSVRLTFRHRFSIFNVTGNYTYQNGYEDNSDFGISTNSYDPRADLSTRGMSKHTWFNTVNARLPLGLFLTETTSANSGRFYSITTGEDDNQDGTTTDRPAGFGRNSETGPWRVKVDLNLSKAFFMGTARGGTRKNVNVFANITNVFNTVFNNNPSGVMSSENFGKVTGATDPREVEIGLRFQF